MKSLFATLAIGSSRGQPRLGASAAQRRPSAGSRPNSPLGGAPPAPFDHRVIKAGSATPDLTPAADLKAPTLDLPNEPIEPYLLTKENGPFMVLARVFRGVDAERLALALVKELPRNTSCPPIFSDQGLPGQKHNARDPPRSRAT